MVLLFACAEPAPVTIEATTPSAVDVDARLRETRAIAPPGFTVVVERPFVVAGDEEPAIVAARAEQTVRPVVAAAP